MSFMPQSHNNHPCSSSAPAKGQGGGGRKPRRLLLCISGLFWLFATGISYGYPLDGFSETGIRRLLRLQRLAEKKDLWTLVRGARLESKNIRLQLSDKRAAGLFPLQSDPLLQQRLEALLAEGYGDYAVGLLDITPDRSVRYAGLREERLFAPGSVGKLAVVAGLFSELARLFPDDPSKRQALLHNRMVTAGAWIHRDHHVVPFYDPETDEASSRPIREGDVFSLYEWTDHMLSASANAAASTVWKEVMLMRRFGAVYPPSAAEEQNFFSGTDRGRLRSLAMEVVNEPLRHMGIKAGDWQLGSFFTAAGKRMVPIGGGSHANVRGFLTYMINLEKGGLVDPWSSLEVKKLLYLTIHRIRYASSPKLADAAVYFKSGSFYKCAAEKGFICGDYKGNVFNYMNSVAIVEHPDGRSYLVVVLSNVLRKNSAIEHQSLAGLVDGLIEPPGSASP